MKNTDELSSVRLEIIEADKKIDKLKEKFYSLLSRFSNLGEYFKVSEEIKIDEQRAEFLCILIKISDLKKWYAYSAKSIKINRGLYDKRKMSNEVIDINLQLMKLPKIQLNGCCTNNWDEYKICYEFDCLELAQGKLIGSKTKGEIIESIDNDPDPNPTEKKYRDDEDLRIIIDDLFLHLKKKSKAIIS